MDNDASNYLCFLDGDDEGFAEIIREYKDGLMLYLESFTHNLLGAYFMDYPYSRYIITVGCWKFNITFTNTAGEGQVELLKDPMCFQIQRMTLTDYVDATVSSIRLKGLGLLFCYTIDSVDIQEAGVRGCTNCFEGWANYQRLPCICG